VAARRHRPLSAEDLPAVDSLLRAQVAAEMPATAQTTQQLDGRDEEARRSIAAAQRMSPTLSIARSINNSLPPMAAANGLAFETACGVLSNSPKNRTSSPRLPSAIATALRLARRSFIAVSRARVSSTHCFRRGGHR
jgi:hypothetical protein